VDADVLERLRVATRSNCSPRLERAQILMASMVDTPVYQIALICNTDEAYVRKVIHAFNDVGFESLNPKSALAGRRRLSQPSAIGS
jgi:hypothetical protein